MSQPTGPSWRDPPPAPQVSPGLPPVAPKRRGVLTVIVLVLLVLALGGGGAAGYFLWYAKRGAKLAASVPATTRVYLEVPNVPGVLKAYLDSDVAQAAKVDPKKIDEKISGVLAGAFGVSGDAAHALAAAVDSIAFGLEMIDKRPQGAALIGFGKAGPVEDLLKSARFTAKGELAGGKRYELKRGSAPSGGGGTETAAAWLAQLELGDDVKAVVWFSSHRILALGDTAYLQKIGAVLASKEAGKDSLSASEAWKKADLDPGALAIGYVDVNAFAADAGADKELVQGYLSGVAPLGIVVKNSPAGVVLAINGELKGDRILADDPLPSPAPLALRERLPKETVAYWTLSTHSDAHGRELKDRIIKRVSALSADSGKRFAEGLDESASQIGMSADELLSIPGDELAVAALLDESAALDPSSPASWLDKAALAFVADVHDKDATKKLIAIVKDKLKGAGTITDQGDGFDLGVPSGEGKVTPVRFRLSGNMLIVGGGGLADRVIGAVDRSTETLKEDKAEHLAVEATGGKPRMLMWIDYARLLKQGLKALEQSKSAELAAVKKAVAEAGLSLDDMPLTGDKRMTATLAIDLDSRGASWRYRVAGVNGFFTMGVAAGIGVYGVRRYLQSAKSSEAKHTVGAIARAAQAAYEAPGHRLCRSALPVPAHAPRGGKYQPATGAGKDFDSGDAASGWKCLKFSLTQPHYYQYGYVQGGPYKGPARGGPDPGPLGFEAWAEGDLDGNGVTSLFTTTGKIVNGKLDTSPQLFVSNELE